MSRGVCSRQKQQHVQRHCVHGLLEEQEWMTWLVTWAVRVRG